MDENTKRLMQMIRLKPNTAENLPENFNLNPSKPVGYKPELFDLNTYLRLKGSLWDGNYNIDLSGPKNGMLPFSAQYTTPLAGGMLNFRQTLSPENREWYIKYNRQF